MRADVIRYLIMYKFGGVYLDIDYEVLSPFYFENRFLVLPLEKSVKDGASFDQVGNCIFASVPGHKFWKDVVDDLKNNPPRVSNVNQITETTGPQLLTRIYHNNIYNDIYTPDKIVYHPEGNVKNLKIIKTNGISLGIHHTWSSWREKGLMNDLKHLIKFLFRRIYYDNL